MRCHPYLVLLPMLLSNQTHAESLCNSREVLYYSCKTAGTKKLVSLCGSDLTDPKGFWLQYRFGSLGQLELVYPQNRGETKPLFADSGFDVFHMWRKGGWDSEVSFKTHGWSYTIVSWMPVENEMNRTDGILISKNRAGGPTTLLKCMSSPNFGKNGAFTSFVEQYSNAQ